MADQRPIAYWLRLVDDLYTRRFDEDMEEHGLTRRQWQLMNLLAERPASTSELTEKLASHFDDSTGDITTEHVDELAESGWVSFDGERYALSEKGRISLDTLGEVVERNRRELTSNVSDDEYATTTAVLERLARNLGWEG